MKRGIVYLHSIRFDFILRKALPSCPSPLDLPVSVLVYASLLDPFLAFRDVVHPTARSHLFLWLADEVLDEHWHDNLLVLSKIAIK